MASLTDLKVTNLSTTDILTVDGQSIAAGATYDFSSSYSGVAQDVNLRTALINNLAQIVVNGIVITGQDAIDLLRDLVLTNLV